MAYVSINKITIRTVIFFVLVVGCCVAQTYPDKTIRIVTSGVGGNNDFAARMVAYGLTGALGQSVIVENHGGASAVIPGLTVARASADGYTLLSFSSPLWLLPYLQDNVPYDPVGDFAPIALTMITPNILVVHPQLPVRTVSELIGLARARPGMLNYASTTTGGPNHLSAELFKAMAKVKIVRVSYREAAQSINDLLNGRVELGFPSATAVVQHIKTGKLRALAVTSARPSKVFSTLPTIAAAGLPGYESVLRVGVFAPKATPAPIIVRLNHEIVTLVSRPDVKEKLMSVGGEILPGTPADFAGMINSEMVKMAKVIKENGIRAD
jgi:tripartite-type tricarboxylate transporter receptor subunit TctC